MIPWGPRSSLIPALAPGRGARWVPAALSATAILGVALGWTEPSPLAEARWALVSDHGPLPWRLWTADTALTDYPLEVVLLLPLRGLAELWMPVGVTVWTAVAGLAGAWLAGRWWGVPRAAFGGGVLWQLAAWPALSAGEPTWLVLLALLPLAFGLLLRALDGHHAADAGMAAVPMAAMIVISDGGVPWLLLLGAAAFPLALRGTTPVRAGAGLVGAMGTTLMLTSPVVAVRWSDSPTALVYGEPPLLPLLILAIVGAWVVRRGGGRVLLPALLVFAGLAHPSVFPVSALGLTLLGAACALLRPPQIGRKAPSSPTSIVASSPVNA